MIIRNAEECDLPELLEIYNYEVLHGVATLDLHEKTLDDRRKWFQAHTGSHRIIVAEIDGKSVGSILYVRAKLIAEDGTVKDCISFGPLSVHPDYQRCGIGKALISHSFEKAKEMGATVVVVLGHPSNYVARGF